MGYLLIKFDVACAFLDDASAARDQETRSRSLRRAQAIIQSIERVLENDGLPVEDIIAIRMLLAPLRKRIDSFDRRVYQAADEVAAAIDAAIDLAGGKTLHRFLKGKHPLFCGDLYGMARRLRLRARLESR